MEESEKKAKEAAVKIDKQSYVSDDDEIELYELFMILKRRWKLILGIFVAAVIISASVSFFLLKPVYKSSMLIKSNANVISLKKANINAYQEFSILTKYIKHINYNISSGNYVLISRRLGIPVNLAKHLSSLSVRQVNNSSLVAVVIYVNKTKGFKIIADGVFKEINGSGYFNALGVKNKKYLLYKKTVLIKELDKTDYILNNIETLNKGTGEKGKLKGIYTNPKSLLQESIVLKTEIYKLNYDLKHRLYMPFSLVSRPLTPIAPFKPNKKLIVAVSGISALFFGIFLAVFLEFIKNNKNSHNTCKDRPDNKNNKSDFLSLFSSKTNFNEPNK